MCGRFAIRTVIDLDGDAVWPGGEDPFAIYRIDIVTGTPREPRYNIAPTQTVAAVRAADEGVDADLELVPMVWWFTPSWSKDPTERKYSMFNAKGETVHASSAFRGAWKAGRRCLIPADAFYEWEKVDVGKSRPERRPHAIKRADDAVFCFGGIHERWADRDTGESFESWAILTTPPAPILKEIHHRSPVIVPRKRWGEWLDPTADADAMRGGLGPFADGDFERYEVSRFVSNARNEGERCLQPR